MSYTEPDAVWTMGNRLLECVHAELATLEAGAPARSLMSPGAEIAWDDCECGQLTVHVLRIFPSDSFPILKQTGPFTRCDPKLTVVEYAITILRCVSVSEDDGDAPAAAALHADAYTDQLDRAAVRRAVVCCLKEDDPRRQLPFLMQEQLAVGSEGQCMGSELHVFVGLYNCQDC